MDVREEARGANVNGGEVDGLPVMDEVRMEARLRKGELLSLTTDATAILNESGKYTNHVLHVTC